MTRLGPLRSRVRIRNQMLSFALNRRFLARPWAPVSLFRPGIESHLGVEWCPPPTGLREKWAPRGSPAFGPWVARIAFGGPLVALLRFSGKGTIPAKNDRLGPTASFFEKRWLQMKF